MNRSSKLLSLALTFIMVLCFAFSAAAEDTVLTLGIWPEDTKTDEIAVHEGYVKTFNETHPNVKVVPAYYKYATDTFVPMAEAGNLPVIFETWFTEPQKLINGEFIADITDILNERGWADAINPSIRDIFSKDGRIYAIPRDGYALGLMVNADLFAEAGLVDENGVPLFPKTMDELAETAKKIKDATGMAGIVILAKDNAGGWHFSNIAWNFGATLVTENEDGTFTANLNSPEAIEAMEWVKSLKWDYDVLTPDPTNEDWGTGFAALGAGTAAMYIAANDATDQPTRNYGLPAGSLAMGAIPAGPRGDQYSLSGGTPYVFSKDATPDQINAALDYLEVMGKAPVVSETSIAGWEAAYAQKAAENLPVIRRFPCWVNQEVIDAEQAVIDKYANVKPEMFEQYFNATEKEGNLRVEEPGLTQDMYAELTKVLQAVLTDADADVAALMTTANDNYQALLDDM